MKEGIEISHMPILSTHIHNLTLCQHHLPEGLCVYVCVCVCVWTKDECDVSQSPRVKSQYLGVIHYMDLDNNIMYILLQKKFLIIF